MEEGNHSVVTEFILLGLTDRPELQVPLFVLFLLIYVTTLICNGGMILLITIDPQLHTPMYFFLRTLSFCDFCCSTVIAPKMLQTFFAERKSISRTACAVQMYFFLVCIDIECLLLAVGLVDAMMLTCCTFQLSFCRSNIINHFSCDIPPLLVLSCSDTRIIEIMMFASTCYIIVISSVTILLSYVYIISAILQIHSAEGRYKAFSTCSSHLSTVVIFHGTLIFMSLRPSSSYSMDTDKIASVFYTMVIPMLNPLIYSLRNREVKDAVKKAMNNLLVN
uniref:G-protein coupled receptors family 1 profile domain-containing protein n=1 Tax=Pelodiscus sinensis TaxID=13735 RepID=K7GIQ5_PELSI